MKNKKFKIGILALSATLFLGSCGGNEGDELINEIDIDTNATVDTDNQLEVEYAVPTPNELFEIIKLQGGEEKVGLVNSLDNKDNYVETSEKALAFGVYSADLAYMSCFGVGTEFLRYMKLIEEMGEELGIEGAFDEELMDRIENNEGDTDTLFAISNETYYDSYLYLEENGKGAELSLIMGGGYIESLYIICNLVDGYKENDPIIEKIGDQKLVLENLMEFVSTYGDDEGVSNMVNDLISLQDVFEASMGFEESGTNVDNNDGKLVISGGGAYTMNEQALKDITAKVTELRENIIN
ncbi:hypothetical protein K6119_19385 [Paracrocinitomix mangrovi]|uniref:hypothetical protein n=1 Tax=Paracrocinitomix mangrovi TaxID=2862509 RepID=UPI001C8E2049|nr:hypothetical protein [Paracrocinitomix mangrovi]UKN01890.1 hypothetical protein K6119_19385 [Paracrocinitomix mangrovi]